MAFQEEKICFWKAKWDLLLALCSTTSNENDIKKLKEMVAIKMKNYIKKIKKARQMRIKKFTPDENCPIVKKLLLESMDSNGNERTKKLLKLYVTNLHRQTINLKRYEYIIYTLDECSKILNGNKQ